MEEFTVSPKAIILLITEILTNDGIDEVLIPHVIIFCNNDLIPNLPPKVINLIEFRVTYKVSILALAQNETPSVELENPEHIVFFLKMYPKYNF
jgi:hypothetical protein